MTDELEFWCFQPLVIKSSAWVTSSARWYNWRRASPRSPNAAAPNVQRRRRTRDQCALPNDLWRIAPRVTWSEPIVCAKSNWLWLTKVPAGAPSVGSMLNCLTCDVLPARLKLPADCKWHPWSAWSPCSSSCGVGSHFRRRSLLRPERYSGQCKGLTFEVGACFNGPCRGLCFVGKLKSFQNILQI